MGSILSPAIEAIRHIEAQAIASNGVKGYRPQHGPNGGECAVTLGTLPVLVRYELTWDGADEIAEIVAVSINGHEIDAGDFAADTRRRWADECMQSRGGI